MKIMKLKRSFQERISQSQDNHLPKRIIVETDLLLELFSVCKHPGCGSAIDRDNIQVKTTGAAVGINATCNNSHENTWSSSSKVGEGKKQSNLINIEMAAYTLFSGLNISQVSLNIIRRLNSSIYYTVLAVKNNEHAF